MEMKAIDLAKKYSEMSDHELLVVSKKEGLTDIAKVLVDAEIKSRGAIDSIEPEASAPRGDKIPLLLILLFIHLILAGARYVGSNSSSHSDGSHQRHVGK